jgi:hypothetical protein
VGLLEDSPRHTATPRGPLRAKRRATLDAPFARRGAPVVAVRRSPALRASPRAGDEPRMDAHVDGARRRHRRRSDRPTRARIAAPAVGLLEDSPRHTATPRGPLRAKRRATLHAPFARQGAPVVAVRRSPALRASPRAGDEPRMDATLDRRDAAASMSTRSTNPCANRGAFRGLARRLAAPHGYTSHALAGEETRDPRRSVRPAGRTSRSRAAQPGFAG